MRTLRLLALLGSALAIGLSAASGIANAQSYPNKPIRVVVPYAPGGVADSIARLVSLRLSEMLGQSMVIENRPGASGTTGVDSVVRASEPDGYTLLMTTGDFITVPSLMPKTNYNPDRDIIPITMLANAPLLMIASIQSGFLSFGDVIAAAKAKPGTVTFSSPGAGTINRLSGEWAGIASGTSLLHVPYRGGAPASTAVATGEVALSIAGLPSGVPLVQAGKARAIGVLASQRLSFAKDLPTLAENGLPGVESNLWVGLFAPAGTPPAIIARLDEAAQKVLAEPFVRERMNTLGTEPDPLGPAAFAQRIRDDRDRYAKIIKQTGAKGE